MIHRHPCFLRLAAALLLSFGAACDESTPDEPVARALPCDLADADCAALPAAGAAFELLESMGVDVADAHVELIEPPDPGWSPADAPDADALSAADPGPQYQRVTCNNNGQVSCCCRWDGPEWGCKCF